jgi:hypothetical protein
MNQLTPLDEGLWTIRFPFSMSGIHLGTRTTIVDMGDGLVLISPGPFSEPLLEEIRGLGPVRALVAPNMMHHLFMERAQRAFPEASVWLAPGLETKRPDLRFDEMLGAGQPPWHESVEQIFVPGMPKLNETAFFHKTSSTLILTDLAFNFATCDHWPTKLVLRLNGALGRFGPSRLLRHFFLEDTGPFSQALSKILEWPFERVVVAHGEVLERGGQQAMREGYGWLP